MQDPKALLSILIIAVLFLTLFLAGFLILSLYAASKKRKKADGGKTSEVGFVVETFHELVSKLKEKERELEELRASAEARADTIEGYNENILESVPSGVITLDESGSITKVNSQAERILDLDRRRVSGRPYAEVFQPRLAELMGSGLTIERGEVPYTTGSGKRIWLGFTVSPLRDSGGGTIGRLIVFSDLTDLKAFAEQAALRDRLASLGEMSAGIAHELKNSLAVIAGYAKILSKNSAPQFQKNSDSISKEVAVMDKIINDFLSFAKPREPKLADVRLRGLVEEAVGCAAETPGIETSIDVDDAIVVRADEVLIRQALSNLVQNAAEAMPSGGRLAITARKAGDNGVEITVSDTGHGIPENVREKIFLPFFTTKEKGTGLGLALVHSIVVSHGGSVRVDTSPEGTAFHINLPRLK